MQGVSFIYRHHLPEWFNIFLNLAPANRADVITPYWFSVSGFIPFLMAERFFHGVHGLENCPCLIHVCIYASGLQIMISILTADS